MEEWKSCCFTGHRPKHLPWGEEEGDPRCVQARYRIAQELERAVQDGFRYFYSGMALGADLIFSEAVLACAIVHPEIELLAAIPCEDQTRGWPLDQKERYERILKAIRPENRILVQKERSRGCMTRRDRYMVNHSSRIIALYDGVSKGGTYYTLSYAMSKGLETVIIDPSELLVEIDSKSK